MKNQRKCGLLLSYINLAIGMVLNFVLTPMLITALSDETYSLYKVIQSVASPLVLFNLGLAGVATRCVAKYRAFREESSRERQNALAMTLLVALTMACVIVLAGIVLAWCVPYVYGGTYSEERLVLAKRLVIVFALSAAVNVLVDIFGGCVDGNEHFAYRSAVSVFHTVFRFAVTVLCLRKGMGALSVAFVGLADNLIVLVLLVWYSVGKLGERFRLYRWDRAEFKGMLSFSAAILLQTIVNQVNNNMDVMILGALIEEKWIITMYTSALTIFVMYNSLLSVIPGIFLPQTVRMVQQGCSGDELTQLVIRAGRFQTTLAVWVLCGFALFGKEFVGIWIGSSYENAYYITLALMIPVTVPLVQNTCLNILDAKLKRMFRSVLLAFMAGLNLILSVILVKHMGYRGAVIGTVVSLLVGHGLIMNLYYQKVLGMNVRRMFAEMFRGILPSGILSLLACVWFALRPDDGRSLGAFICKCLLFSVFYFGFLWLFGWNREEKSLLKQLAVRRR